MYKQAILSFSVVAQSFGDDVTSIQFSTQDKNTAKLIFVIKEGKQPLDLTDVEGLVDLVMGDKSVFDDNKATVTSPLDGKLEYTITPEQIRHSGRAKGELQLVSKDGQAIGGFRFNFTIKPALVDEYSGPVKEFYIQDLEAVKQEVQEKADTTLSDIDNIKAQIEETAESIKDIDVVRIDTELKAKVSKVNGKAPDSNGNVTIPVPEVDTTKLATKTELNSVTTQLADTTKALEPITSQYHKDSRGKVNLFIETPYDGGNQPYHPSVQRFDTAWNGYKYWMAYTPYPYGDDFAENPCIVVSNDLLYWSEPPGLVNPIDSPEAAMTIGIHYWSDTELVYNPDTKNLECWYRGVGRSGGVTIVRKTSSNGVNWSEREVLFTTTGTVHVSHSVIYENGKYKIWLLSPNLYFETSDPKNWGASRTYTLGDYWHGQVRKTSKGYEYFVHVNWPNNFAIDHFISQDGINFTKTMKVISSHGDMGIPYGIDAAGIYRPCFIVEGGRYYLFYCTGAKDIRKGITLSISENMDLKTLRGIDESFVKYMKKPTKRSMYGFEGDIFDKTDNTMNRCLSPSTTKRVPCKWVTEKIKESNDMFTLTGMEANTTIDAVTGEQSASDLYHTSALIPLKPNTLIEFTRRRWTVANFYDASKTRISGISVSGEKTNTAYIRPPTNAHYIRFNYYKPWLDLYTFRQFTDFSAGTTWEQGKIDNTGSLATDVNSITTGFLAVNSSSVYKIVDDTTLVAGLATFAEYDTNKNFVKLTSAYTLLTSPITKFVKVTLNKSTGITPSNGNIAGVINP